MYANSDEESTPGVQELVERYKVESFPTFLYLSPEGEILHRVEGVPDEVAEKLPRRGSRLCIGGNA